MNAIDHQVLTVSSAKCFRRCAREYQIRYEEGWRPAKTEEPLRVGAMIHAGLEAWWKAAIDSALDAALDAMCLQAVDAFDLVRAEELMRGYHARWAADRASVLVLGVESVFYAPLINPETGSPSRTWILGGKLDVIVQNDDGRKVLIEHKTSSEDISAGSDYWKMLVLDAQISTYHAGARVLGHNISECLYDVIGKPGLRPFKATPMESRKYTKDGKLYAAQRETDETPSDFRERIRAELASDPEAYYRRGVIVRLEEEERDAAFDVWQIGRMIREAQLAKRWPRNPESCKRFGRHCSYFPVCSRTGSLEDKSLYVKVPADQVHSELAEADAS